MRRRSFLKVCCACAGGLALGSLGGCLPDKEGPEDIHYGRDVCEICRMIISDPRFAAEVRGGPHHKIFKFDDIGDAIHWLEMQPWKDDPAVEVWVRDYPTGERWLDARKAYYQSGVISPMDYGFGAVETPAPDTVEYAVMVREVIAMGLSGRVPPDVGAVQ